MTAALVGIHHVRIPVSDVLISRDWYADVLGLQPILVEEDEAEITGIVLQLSNGIMIGLHHDPERAAALRGYAVVAFAARDLDAWCERLDHVGVAYGPITDAHIGLCLTLDDPDGVRVEIHTDDQPSTDEA